MTVSVRQAKSDDLDAAKELLEAAFERPDEARLVGALWESDDHFATLMAEGDTGVAVLSHLKMPSGCLALGPIAVASERRNQGVGQALIAAAVDCAREAEVGGIFVLGRPRYYTRFGFSVEAAAPFRSDYPAEFMLALPLGSLPAGGPLRYAPAFAALG